MKPKIQKVQVCDDTCPRSMIFRVASAIIMKNESCGLEGTYFLISFSSTVLKGGFFGFVAVCRDCDAKRISKAFESKE